MCYIRLEREEWEGWDSFERRLERCPAKAIKNTENQIVYLIYGKDIKSGRIRDTNCGYKGGDYAFDNRDSTCLSDAIAAYKYTHIRMPQWLHWICRKKKVQNGLKIEVDGPEKVIIKNYSGERQTKMEKFFNAWAAQNVNYAKGRYITYWNYPNRRYIWLEYPGMDNLVWKELSDEETNKYIDLYNRAQFPSEWDHGFKECHLDGYKITRSLSRKLIFSIALFEEETNT